MPSQKKDASQKKEKKQKAPKPDEKPAGEPEFVEPYREGLFILCRWDVDGTTRNAEVIEAILAPGADEGDLEAWSYYVHYTDFNRRMDEWVKRDRVLGQGVKVDPHAHDKKEEGDAERDELTMAGAGGGSGSLSATLHKHKKDDAHKKADPDKPTSEFTEAEEEEHEGMDDASLREHEEVTKVKNVKMIELGRHKMETWYFSPFPKEFWQDGPIDTLYCCEFSLNFFKHKAELDRFQKKKHCPRHPPANEIYRSGGVSMFEVNPMDSMQAHHYAQNLCYLAKLFLDHKTLFYDVDPFLFYVLCEHDERGYHPVGYFSKEKYSDQGYNLACILTWPCYQRRGYGRFLIEFSYALSQKEGKVGTPERPLSDLGAVSYRSFWSSVLLQFLKDFPGDVISVMDLAQRLSIRTEDIISTMQMLGFIKYWDGSHIISIPPEELLEAKIQKRVGRGPHVDPERLHWAPLITDVKRDKWSIRSKRQRTITPADS